MPVDYGTAMNEILLSGYEVTKELPVCQVHREEPKLELVSGATIRPGTELVVRAICSGDDGLAAKVIYFQDNISWQGYVPIDDLVDSTDWMFSPIS